MFGGVKMQVKQSYLNNTITKNIISNTAKFIDKNFDFNMMNNQKLSQIKQMPYKQLYIFAKQSFQKQYYINVTMVNDEQFQGKLIKKINLNKYILKVNSSLYSIIDLNNIKSINLI